MRNPVPRITGLLLLAILVGLLSACTSAEELVEDGAELEAQGRYEEAVRKYIAAYDKDPSIIDLEARVTELGNQVISDWYADARSAFDDGMYVRSAETYMQIDDLVLRAAEAALFLDRPADYGDRRYEAFRRAVRVLEDTALDRFEQGDLAAADGLFKDALARFDPTPDETHELLVGRHNVLLAWTDQATANGHFREAVSRADEALAIAEQAGIPVEDAVALRMRAIDLGTLYVAAAPVRGIERGRDAVSPWIMAELNDRLELDYWTKPPEFVAMAHGALVRQRIRSLGFGRRPLSRHDARILASDLGSHLVVLTEVERFNWEEEDIEERPASSQNSSRSGGRLHRNQVADRLPLGHSSRDRGTKRRRHF